MGWNNAVYLVYRDMLHPRFKRITQKSSTFNIWHKHHQIYCYKYNIIENNISYGGCIWDRDKQAYKE